MNFDQDDIDEWEQALQDTSVKALLITQTQELREIRYQMQLLTDALSVDTEAPETVLCGFCGDEVPEPDQREHLTEEHNAPGSVPLSEVFVR